MIDSILVYSIKYILQYIAYLYSLLYNSSIFYVFDSLYNCNIVYITNVNNIII